MESQRAILASVISEMTMLQASIAQPATCGLTVRCGARQSMPSRR
jgi:hypothetical protein